MNKAKPDTYYYKFLAKNISWLFVGRIVAKICSLLVLPIMTLYLSPEEYGIITLFIVEAAFIAGLCDLGLGSFSGRMIYKYERRNKKTCQQYIGVMFFYVMSFSFLGFLIAIPFMKFIARIILKGVTMPHEFFYYIPLVYAFFLNIFGFSTGCFLQLQQNKKLFLCEMLEIFFILPLQIIGLVWFDFSWVEVVVLQLVGKIISSVYSLWLVRKEMKFSFKRLRIIKYALKYSLPMIPMQFAGILHKYIDKIFLVNMVTVSSVGVYTIGSKLSEVFSFFSRPILTTIKPEISKRLDSRNSNIQKDIAEVFNIFFHASLFVVFIASIFSCEVISIFVNERYSKALLVIPVMMFTYMFGGLRGIFGIKIQYKNKTAFFSLITILGVICNGILNYILIKRFDIFGAALATMLAGMITFTVTYLVSQKLHYSQYNLAKNFGVLFCVSIAIVLIQKYLGISLGIFIFKLGLSFGYIIILYMFFSKSSVRFRVMKDLVLKNFKKKFKVV